MLPRIIALTGILICNESGFFAKQEKRCRLRYKRKPPSFYRYYLPYAETGMERGEVLIRLHGFTGTSRSFYPMMDLLPEVFL